MDTLPAPTKQDGELSVQYNSFTGVMEFFFWGEKIYQKTIPECEKVMPHIIWYKIKQDQHIRHIL